MSNQYVAPGSSVDEAEDDEEFDPKRDGPLMRRLRAVNELGKLDLLDREDSEN
jgi:hypothetical protein